MVIEIPDTVPSPPLEPTAPTGDPSGSPGRLARFLRYAVSSALATLVSAATFAVAYRVLDLGPRTSTAAAFVAGALVNFSGNRFWAWARHQRSGLGRDIAGYAVLALGTAAAAAGVTSVAQGYANRVGLGPDARAALVEGAYFAVYAAMFLVKFVLLDRVLFRTRSRHQVPTTTRA